MNNGAKAGWIAAATALVTLLAANGKALAESAHAIWLFLISLSSDAPLGLSSALLALGISCGVQAFLRYHWRATTSAAWRTFAVDSLGVGIALGVMWLQLRTMNGALLGVMVGFMAPWVSRGVAAGACLSWRAATGRQLSGREDRRDA